MRALFASPIPNMPVVIRRILKDRFKNHTEIAHDSWDLRTQIQALEEWLTVHPHELDPSNEWVADIGFTVRLDATGGGPPISRKLMEMCVGSNLEIYLSEYGAEPSSDKQ
jgi:hypothetical protein